MSELVARAEEFARLIHRNQKYGDKPYSYHLKQLVSTLKELGITKDEVLVASAWLHDSIEDTETTYETLKTQFGESVADIVLAVTNEEGKNRIEKLEKIALKLKDNEKALLLKLVDRVVNTEESLGNDEKLYKMYKKEFPLFRELLYDDKSISYPIIYLWYYLENLYRNEEERLTIEEIENIAKDIYSYSLDQRDLRDSPWVRLAGKYENDPQFDEVLEYIEQYRKELDEREAEYYDNCYQIVEERMYDQ